MQLPDFSDACVRLRSSRDMDPLSLAGRSSLKPAGLQLHVRLILATLAVVKELAEPESLSATSVSPDPKAPIPKQIRYIIGNEGCERFSFYGMRNILTVFLVSSLLLYLPESERARGAKDVFHTFVIGVYFFPLLGGWLADRFFGKYNTVFWLSLVYCVGQACLAMFVTNRTGFYIGLGLIALGSGGIKPCVAAFVGDQFDQTNKHRAKVVFEAFYWIINFGSFFASLLMPIFLRHLGPAVAFGVPGVLMFISTAILWLGRKQYVMIPPAPPNPHSFLRVSRDAIASGLRGQLLAAIAIASVIGSFALTPKFGFVIAACLALVGLIAFGGLGVWLQLDCVREQTSRGSYRRRAFGFACPCAVRVGDAVLVVVRSESIDVGVAGERDGEAELVSARTDASTESCTRDAPDSVQQPCALPRTQPFRIRTDTITANDCGHRVCRSRHGSWSARCNLCSITATCSRSRGKCCLMCCSRLAKCWSPQLDLNSLTARRRCR